MGSGRRDAVGRYEQKGDIVSEQQMKRLFTLFLVCDYDLQGLDEEQQFKVVPVTWKAKACENIHRTHFKSLPLSCLVCEGSEWSKLAAMSDFSGYFALCICPSCG